MTKYEIEKFIRKFNIEKYLNEHNIEYGENETQYIIRDCPHCKSHNYKGNYHPNKFYMNRENKKYLCYNCNREKSLLTFFSAVEDISIKQVFEKYFGEGFFEALPRELKSEIEEEEQKFKQIEEIKIFPIPEEFEDAYTRPQRKFRPVYEYMQDRGINRKIAKSLDVRYCTKPFTYISPSKRKYNLKNRVIFPIYWGEEANWWNKKMVGFQARDITGKSKLPYLISEGLPKRKIIYNYSNVFEKDTITICEGIFDLAKCWDYNPILLFGKTVSEEQLSLLQKMPNLKNIIIALDPDTKLKDDQGNIPYQKLVDNLKSFWNILEVDIPFDKDPGDLAREEMNKLLSNAYPYKSPGLTSLID